MAQATGSAILIGFVTAVAILMASSAMLQDRMLYFPARAPLAEMVGSDLRPWPNEQAFRGLMATPPGDPGGPSAGKGTALVFHGNAGHAAHRSYYAQALTALGLRVILAEYPGYGPRPGEPGEASLVSDAEETIALAHRMQGEPLLVIGESLGAAVAAAAAARQQDKVSGLLLITPWERLEQVASFHYPWLPVKWILRDRYDTAASLREFRRPVVVAVAESDAIVPARFGQALHENLAPPKALLVIEAAGHNDWPSRIGAGWWAGALAPLMPKGAG